MAHYIQRFGQGQRETVDEVQVEPQSLENPRPNREARRKVINLLNEYRISDPSAEYYVSSRPCANWK